MVYFYCCLLVTEGDMNMANQKHLTLDQRIEISNLLDQKYSFKAIALKVDKDCTTISKEIRAHLIFRKTGCYGKNYNACSSRYSCDKRHLCDECPFGFKKKFCWQCKSCNSNCSDYKEQQCKKLMRAPYICNGCSDLNKCTLEKSFYKATLADIEYRSIYSEARTGISLSEDEVKRLNQIISPLIMKGQSLNHICVNNQDSIMISESTLYRLVNYNVFTARNIDLARKVRFSKRKAKKNFKVDKGCRIGRTYEDFKDFMETFPDLPITEIDSVEGNKGGKVLLTIHFVKAEFMLAFLRDANDSRSVISIFERLYLELSPELFTILMPVLLGDNGSEFSNPVAIEQDLQGNERTHLFYCDPSAPYQKGSAEKNHEFIRYLIPKGHSLDSFTQADITLMMNHINSYSRKSLGNKSPYEVFSFLYGEKILDILGCNKILANDVTLNKSLFKNGLIVDELLTRNLK